MDMKLTVNGSEREVDLPADTPLLWALRDGLGMTGTKYGCGMALCGACTVHLDGKAIRSCVTPLSAVEGKEIRTIEGLSDDASHPVQQAWLEADVAQCGYCQSGQIMGAAALLASNPEPDEAAIITAMNGHLCRCGTYNQVREAIGLASKKLKEAKA
jgi:aerobic-type carbon monoxide dehydrogenase small subunit (CoxS/CutS family)